MLKKKNGFSLIEVLFASSLFFQAFLIFIPIQTNIQASTEVLNEKRWAAIRLHNELQQLMIEDSLTLPYSIQLQENHTNYDFEFTKKETWVKGCVEWNNAKKSNEIICLYGLPQK